MQFLLDNYQVWIVQLKQNGPICEIRNNRPPMDIVPEAKYLLIYINRRFFANGIVGNIFARFQLMPTSSVPSAMNRTPAQDFASSFSFRMMHDAMTRSAGLSPSNG
jgi:hypothetical protein